ncbi:MAG TPA: hypothetical protein PKA82_04775 [Pyrinomonadaceae bacterium]|nr:hypothetical protein [Pyrinomonadaceae bacterium]
MKFTAILILALAASCSIFGQNARDLYMSLPEPMIKMTSEQRTASITEDKGSLLELSLAGGSKGELKLVSSAKGETIVGLTVSSCDASELKFYSLKASKWSDVTARVIKPLGKSDVIEILKASPAEISSLSEKIEIAYFYTFAADTTKLELIARKQGSCDIAGRVYGYSFNGKRYDKDK